MECPNCGQPIARPCGDCRITRIPLSREAIMSASIVECVACHAVFNVLSETVVTLKPRQMESEV